MPYTILEARRKYYQDSVSLVFVPGLFPGISFALQESGVFSTKVVFSCVTISSIFHIKYLKTVSRIGLNCYFPAVGFVSKIKLLELSFLL